MLWRWWQVLFVSFTLFHNFAFKLVTFILTVNLAITAGQKTDTESIIAGVLFKTVGAEAHPLDFGSTRESAKVINHLPIVVAEHKAGKP